MARKCPDGRWSAIQSIYPEHCVEHMNVNAAVAVVLFFMLLFLGFCVWASYWEWIERDEKAWLEVRRKNRQHSMYRREAQYGGSFGQGAPYDVYQVYSVQP